MSLRIVLLLAALCCTAEGLVGGAARTVRKAPVKKVAKKAPVRKAAPPKRKAPVRRQSSSFDSSANIGVTPPLGVFDPLNLISRGPAAYRRFEEMEIKHGRLAMAATVHVFITEVPRGLAEKGGWRRFEE